MQRVVKAEADQRADRRRKHPRLSLNIKGHYYDLKDISMGGCKLTGATDILELEEEYTAFFAKCSFVYECTEQCGCITRNKSKKIDLNVKLRPIRKTEDGAVGCRLVRLTPDQFVTIDSIMSCKGSKEVVRYNPCRLMGKIAKVFFRK